MIKIKLISDLHIGIKNSEENDFQLDDNLFIKYLEGAFSDCDLFIFLGDVFETWETLKWDKHREKFFKILSSRPALSEFILKNIEKEKIIYINGNHDSIVRIENLISGVKKRIIKNFYGLKILFEHGHRADLFNSKHTTIGKIIVWILTLLEKIGFKDFDKDLRLLSTTEVKNGLDRTIFLKYAEELKEKLKVDIVILGHTHVVSMFKKENFCYINTGKCCDENNMFNETTIKIESDKRYFVEQVKIKL